MLAAEGVTVAVLGPLSYLLVYLVATGSPYKTPVQVICSFGHLYSDTLYYVTSLIDFYIKGIDHCRPEPFYFWVYYVGMNAAWIVVPLGRFSERIPNHLADLYNSFGCAGCARYLSGFRRTGSYGEIAADDWHIWQGCWQLIGA